MLTLENVTLNATANEAINGLGSLAINLVGENAITNTTGKGIFFDNSGDQTLTFKGKGSLTVTSYDETIQAEYHAVFFDGCKLNLTSQDYWSVLGSNVTIKNGASVTISSVGVGLYGKYGISAQGDSTVDVTSSGSETNALYAENGPVAIEGSSVKAKVTSEDSNPAIWCSGNFSATDGSSVVISGAGSHAVYSDLGDATIAGSYFEASSNGYAIYPYSNVMCDGAELAITGANGIGSYGGSASFKGTTGSIEVNNAAIYVGYGDVTFSDGCDLVLSGGLTLNVGNSNDPNDIEVTESKLTITGSEPLYAEGDVSIIGSQINVIAKKRPIVARNGTLSISGDNSYVKAHGSWYINGNTIEISGGTVDVVVNADTNESAMGAMFANAGIEISGGTVFAAVSGGEEAKTYAAMSNGEISITGGSTMLKGGTGAVYVSKNGGSLGFGDNPGYQWSTESGGSSIPNSKEEYTYDPTDPYLRIEPIGATYTLTVDGVVQENVPAGQTVSVSAAKDYDETEHFDGWELVSGLGVSLEDVGATGSFPMPASDVEMKSAYENHIMTEHSAKAPTCVSEGWEAYQACSGCDYTVNKVTIPATGQHTYVDGVCTVCGARQPQPQPSRPTYPPEVPEADGGTVEVSPSRPHRGDEVTVTPQPEEGQEVVGVTVTDENGNDVEVADNGDGTWSFEQPSGKVTIEVTFGCDGGEVCPSRGYADVDQADWYHDAVDWAVTTGTMTGYADGTYGPADPLSRAQLATVLWRLAGEPEGSAALPADCGAGEFYSGAVPWALGEEIFTGYESGLFGPADDLTREQAATVLWRAAGSPEAECDLSDFPDAGDVSEFAETAVRWAVSEGVMRGQGDGTLDPQGTCSRAEVAALMMRLSVAE